MSDSPITIWIDGDAAPKAAKAVVYKASARTGIQVVVVANRPQVTPRIANVRFQQVGGGHEEGVGDHEHISFQPLAQQEGIGQRPGGADEKGEDGLHQPEDGEMARHPERPLRHR